MDGFRFELSAEEKAYLKDVVRRAMADVLAGDGKGRPPEPPTDKLREKLGAFVTLSIGGHLRGCIGRIVGGGPLYLTIAEMARAAAFEDPRFPPVSAEELPQVQVEISILSPITPCPDPALIEVGRHGLIVKRGGAQGLLLPQVPVEWKWDRETFLGQTCRKAGLPADAWRRQGTDILWFEAEVF
jgi:uncharacterized protein